MPYGQGQALGANIDPRMFVQDYSGFANAAAIQAAGMMNFGNQIGGAISDYAKESKALKGEIAKGKSALAFAKAYHPELADQIDQLGQIFQDPTKSTVEQAAAGSQMGDFVAAMLGGERFKQEMDFKKREADLREKALIGELNAPQETPWELIQGIDDGKGGKINIERNKFTGQERPAHRNFAYEDPTLIDLPGLDANGNPPDQFNGMVLPNKGDIGGAIAQASRLGYKPPEGGTGQVMSPEEVAKLVEQGLEFKAEPAKGGDFRVTEIKSSATPKPPKGEIMSKDQVAELYRSGQGYKAEPVGEGQYRVTEIRGGKDNFDKYLESMKEAQKLFKEGKREEAAVIMNALRMQAFSMPMNPENLNLLFGEDTETPYGNNNAEGNTPGESTPPLKPLSERLKELQGNK